MADDHVPVLLEEVLAGLAVRPGGRYIDATLGGGGHAREILRRSAPDGRLLGLDADAEVIEAAESLVQDSGTRMVVAASNFRKIRDVADEMGFRPVDGILMDLGVSSRQLSDGQRGFSFSHDGPLDMRLSRTQGPTAADLVNELPEADLADLIYRFGEERLARRIARAVVKARPLATTGELAKVVARVVGWRQRIDPATRTFQALRIAVNDELGALEAALPQAVALLGPGGRLAIIAFHSLEDRLVKLYFQREGRDCICPPEAPVCTCGHAATLRVVTRKPIRPTEAEVERNRRSRSARLRIAERLDGPAGDTPPDH